MAMSNSEKQSLLEVRAAEAAMYGALAKLANEVRALINDYRTYSGRFQR